jgi:hypothetical protein
MAAPHRELSFRGSAALHLRLPRARARPRNLLSACRWPASALPALALSGRVVPAGMVRAAASGHAVAASRFLGPAPRVASRECGAAGPRNDTSVFIRRVRAPLNDSWSHDSLPVHTESSYLVLHRIREKTCLAQMRRENTRRRGHFQIAAGVSRSASPRLCVKLFADRGLYPRPLNFSYRPRVLHRGSKPRRLHGSEAGEWSHTRDSMASFSRSGAS